MVTFRITELEPYGEVGMERTFYREWNKGGFRRREPAFTSKTRRHGWQWSVKYSNGTVNDYRTDVEGDGLWIKHGWGAPWKQVRGTCQFSLPMNRRAVLRKIRRELTG